MNNLNNRNNNNGSNLINNNFNQMNDEKMEKNDMNFLNILSKMPQNKEEELSIIRKKVVDTPEGEKIYEVKYTSTFVKGENNAQKK